MHVKRPALDVVRVDIGATEAESGGHAGGASVGQLLLVREAVTRGHNLLLEVDTSVHCEFEGSARRAFSDSHGSFNIGELSSSAVVE